MHSALATERDAVSTPAAARTKAVLRTGRGPRPAGPAQLRGGGM